MIRVLLIVIGYIFGLIQTGYIYGKITGIDLKKSGSGNTGATNALRVGGIKSGLIVFFFDALKAFIPCFTVRLIFKDDLMMPAYLMWTAFGVSLGNDYPFYLGFKGGKGVAVTSGWGLAWSLPGWIVGMGVFFILAFATKIVSIASIIDSVVIFAMSIVYGYFHFGDAFMTAPCIEYILVVFLCMALMVYRHKDNIKRLMNGTENKFGSKKKEN